MQATFRENLTKGDFNGCISLLENTGKSLEIENLFSSSEKKKRNFEGISRTTFSTQMCQQKSHCGGGGLWIIISQCASYMWVWFIFHISAFFPCFFPVLFFLSFFFVFFCFCLCVFVLEFLFSRIKIFLEYVPEVYSLGEKENEHNILINLWAGFLRQVIFLNFFICFHDLNFVIWTLFFILYRTPPWFEFLVIFYFFGTDKVEGHFVWKFHKQRKSWPNVPPKLFAYIRFLYKVVHKIGRLQKFNRAREIEFNFFIAWTIFMKLGTCSSCLWLQNVASDFFIFGFGT